MASGDWKQWIALVTSKESLATGYPIAPDRVLTALHAVESGAVEVRFYRQDKERSYPATVIWPPEGAAEGVTVLDVAVLELEEAIAECPLAPGPQLDVVTGDRWETEGFPAVSFGKGDDGLEIEPLTGTLHSLAVGASTLKLDLTTFPEGAQGWKGYSGAPVVVGRRLVGLVRQLPKGWHGRVEATTLAALWQAKGFLEAIGDRGVILLRQRFEEELGERLLRLLSQDWLRRALCEKRKWAFGDARAVKEKVLAAGSLEFAIALRDIHYRVEAGLLPGDPRVVQELACTALPQLGEALAAVTSAVRLRDSECWCLTIKTLPVAELVMARLAGRPARFEIRGGTMVGCSLVDLSVEPGIASASFKDRFRYSLARAIGLRVSPGHPPDSGDLDDRIQARLRARAHEEEPERLTYYCVPSRDPTKLLSDPDNRRWVATTYPQLWLLELGGKGEEELDLAEWLEKIFVSPEKGDP